jgi:prepilin-type N-terminal cleavage/methylation domain-containing protein
MRSNQGLTLVELLVTTMILGVVLVVVTGMFLSTNRLHSRTARRAEVQMSSRAGMSLMTTELRQAGADPGDPQIGLVGLVTADSNAIRVRADLNGDGAIQTTEPSEDVTYTFNVAQKAIFRDPGAGAVVAVPNVTNMSLTYFDDANAIITPLPLSAVNAARVRAIGVTITSEDKDSRPITLTTRVTLRNI